MAISYIASATNNTGSSTSITVSVPTGTQDGDVMIAAYGNGQDDGTTPAISGWTSIGYVEDATISNNTLALFYRVASSEPASYTMTYDSSTSNLTSGIISTFRGVDTTTPLDVTYVEGSHYLKEQNVTEANPPSITTTTNGAFVIYVVHCKGAVVTAITPASGYTEAAEIIGNNRYMQMAYKEVPTAGAEDPGVVVLVDAGGTLEDPATMVIAISPAASGSTSQLMLMGIG